LISAPPAETTTDPQVIDLEISLVPPQKPADDAQLKTGCRFRWPSMELKVVKDSHGSNHDTYVETQETTIKRICCGRLLVKHRR
jgi:hypothetical protein